ncbi:hypothetical protein XELAEV_18045356mg [Xenopus laevis]|uniref:Uromodulin n=1 Tax=Xenopus laevis TaxID=8355 RepID=A0A974C0J2_XENLA|nr:hypothetical protein XELAEV_18045356mg [Xenopus laevis]
MMIILLFVLALIPYCGGSVAIAVSTTAKWSSASNSSKILAENNCTSQQESSSLTYLVDTTGSMSDDLQQLKLVNGWLLDRVHARFPCGVRQYTMVEFNDPTVGPVRVTDSKSMFGDFFNSLVASGGDDCPELAMGGLELALRRSPPNSFILVLTDASAKDNNNMTIVNNVRSLINTTKSQIFFLTTGLCSDLNDPQFLIYRELAKLSFGHVFQISLSDLGKAFNYLDFALSRPANSSVRLFSGEYSAGNHSDSFPVQSNFTSLIITTDGSIYSIRILGPGSVDVPLKNIVSEIWGSMYVVKYPGKGIWICYIYAGGPHSIRVAGFTVTTRCSECHANATCEETLGILQCSCKDGFIGDGFSCSDVDECAYSWSNNCSSGICKNTIGSYTCDCRPGYTKSPANTCVDINECSRPDLNNCHALAACINSIGSYSCVCPAGYFGNGFFCSVDECSAGMCGIGMDCIKSNVSFSCSDPCLYHTVLDEPWRSTTNTYLTRYNCDTDKVGWYRFVGAGGVRMPESCVPELSCDTHAPMWISGSHPLLSDGIVNRTACAHWSGNCCLWSTTVFIKACLGGYHVYKLNRTPVCHLTYCTDPSTVSDSPTCAADEVKKSINGTYQCQCKDEYKVSALSEIRPTLTCENQAVRATFQKCQLKTLNIDVQSINLKNSRCFLYKEDNTTNTISILSPLQMDRCGMQLIRNDTHVTYTNTLYLSMESGDLIIRNEELVVKLSCTYQLNMQVSLNTVLHPFVSSTNISIGGTGQFTAYMALYKDNGYLSVYEGAEVLLSSSSILYIGVFLDGVDLSQYAVVMGNCYATPSSNADDPMKYYIIQNSCPNRQDPSITVMENGASSKGRFSVQMFKFIGDHNLVYLYCQIHLCDLKSGSCAPVCSGIRSLSLGDSDYSLSVGPIKRQDHLISGTDVTRAPWILLLSALLLLANTLIV